MNPDLSVPVTFIAFDLLRLDGTELLERPYSERRELPVSLDLHGSGWVTTDAYGRKYGPAVLASVCAQGLEGVVAKKLSSRYRPGARGWVKQESLSYRRREAEVEGVQRSHERRARRATAGTGRAL